MGNNTSLKELKINIAKDFARLPIGRYIEDGPISGEAFRRNILEKKVAEALANNKKLVINFEGMLGINASFLEESFGGLVRHGVGGKSLTAKKLIDLLVFEPQGTYLTSYVKDIKRYINNAENHKEG